MLETFLVAGARPNFMKVAPIYHALSANPGFSVKLVHTGQHYDQALSGVFFQELGLPRPHLTLEVGSGSHAVQTARVMQRFEQALLEHQPDLVIVVGDVNSTVACALVTAKTAYPSGRRPALAHVEAGLRSFDRTMPEEVNRLVTDALSDLLFVSEESGLRNLESEGVAREKVFLVGNVMIDTLLAHAARAETAEAWRRFQLHPGEYALVTLHRPSNVDDPSALAGLVGMLSELAREIEVVFPVHPRTRARLNGAASASVPGLRLTDPLGYVDFLSLMKKARVVITDSGGIQEETTVLGVPCLTARNNTERPATVSHGTNTLVGDQPGEILAAARRVLAGSVKPPALPDLWDGRAAARIVEILDRRLSQGADRD